MRWRGLLEPAFHPRLKQRCATYGIDNLYLCICHFAIRFAHRSHFIPIAHLPFLGLLLWYYHPTHEPVPCSPFSFIGPLLYLLAPSKRHSPQAD